MGLDLERLTRRELEIGALLGDGLTYREIAEKLFISRRTAEWHVEQIQNKLGLRSRSQIAARFAQAEILRSLRTSDEKAGKTQWPAQPTRLLGRDRELADITLLLRRPEIRLVTVTGPPGVGKTSLCVRVAQMLSDEFSSGAFFVDLSAIREPMLVPSAIARVVGVRPKFEEMLSALRAKHMLIILDNFEQVLTAGATVAELLTVCGGIKILVTSRECLHLLRWEQEYALRPLELPDLDHLAGPAALPTVPSIALFVERARARNPGFDFGPSTDATIARICVRLDGIPLAIELAAAATKALPPAMILSRLADHSEIPAQTGPDFPPRHRSLREAIGTSYALLSHDEQLIFRRLGVFSGGFDHDALDSVCTGPGITPDYAIRLLASLVDKSMVQIQQDGARYFLLEIIREYALDALRDSGEADAVFSRHTQHFLKLSESAWSRRRGPAEYEWYARIARDIGNFRAIFSRALADEDADTGLRLGAALSRFLWMYGSWSEARDLLQAFVNKVALNPESERDRVALCELGWITIQLADFEAGRSVLERCVDMARRAGDHIRAATALEQLTSYYLDSNQFAAVVPIIDEAVREARLSNFEPAIVDAICSRGVVWLVHHDDDKASALFDEALTIARERGDVDGVRIGLLRKGTIAFRAADYESAAATWAEALRMFWANGWPSPTMLDSFARLAIVKNEPATALRLAGAADAFRLAAPPGASRVVPWTGLTVVPGFLETLNAIGGGDAKSHPDWIAGRAMSGEEAVEVAMALATRFVSSMT